MTAVRAARRFLTAIYEGDTDGIWVLFAPEARQFVVGRAMRKGLSGDLGRELVDGTADAMERAEFLGDLLRGLQRDLETVDLSRVYVEDADTGAATQTSVVFYERFVVEAGPPLDPLPVGSVEMIRIDSKWRVQRLIPGPPRTADE